MNETLILTLASVMGMFLGAVFYGGLLWTVHKGISSKSPALWFFGSGLARMSITLLGFYSISGGRLNRLSACFLGFLVARIVISHLTRTPEKEECLTGEGSHAP